MTKIIEKLALEQGISEDEASELVNLLMGGEPSEPEESFEDIERDAINKDFDTQMAHDSGEGLEIAQNDLSVAVAKLREARKNKKVAEGLAPEDPKKQQLMDVEKEVFEEHGNDPNLDAEALQTGLGATEEMLQSLAGTADPEEIRAILESNLGLNTVATKRFASWGDPRFGVPSDEGKIYRSWINPLYFKTAKGNLYKMALDPYAEGEEEPVAPAPAPPVTPAPTTPPDANVEEVGQQYSLGEQEKQRLSQLMADAEAQGTSSWKLIGLVAGFVGDKKLLGIPSSQQEIAETQEGFRLGQQARGSGGTTAKKKIRAKLKDSNLKEEFEALKVGDLVVVSGQEGIVQEIGNGDVVVEVGETKKVEAAPVNEYGGPGAGQPNYPSQNATVAPSQQQQNVDPNQQQNMGDVSSILDQVTAIMNDPQVDDQTKYNQILGLVGANG